MRRLTGILTILIVLGLVWGRTGTGVSAPPATKTELVVADALPTVTLDPHKEGFGQADTEIIYGVHDTLLGWKDGIPNGQLEGRLATSWKVSPDGQVWTFTLRKGVVWQRGYGPFTAQDVLFTFNRLMDPKRSFSVGNVKNVIKEVKAIDDHTVEIRLFAPVADFIPQILLAFRTGIILSQRGLAAVGEAEYARHPIGTGPYQVVERVVGQRTVLERNPGYWGKPPNVPRFVFVDIPEESVRADALLAGQIDIGSFRQPPTIDRLAGSKNVKIHSVPASLGTWILEVNQKKVPDVRVREAIARAINKRELAETVLKHRSNPSVVSYLPPNVLGYPKGKTAELYPYNPQRAKELLAAAGVKPGDLTLRFATRADFLELSQAIKAYLEAVGINSNLQLMEQALYRRAMISKGELYDLVITFPTRSNVTELLEIYGNPDLGLNQYTLGPPPRVVELFQAQMREMNPQRREGLIRQMMNLVERDIPAVVFGYPSSSTTANQPFVSGPFINLFDEFHLGLEWIRIDQTAYAEWAKGRH